MNEYKTIKVGEDEIHVAQDISTSDKVSFVDAVLSKSIEAECYNPVLLDAYFHLNLIYLFTDIIFDEDDRADELKLFDEMKSKGLLLAIIQNIPEELYKELLDFVQTSVEKKELFYRSATYNLTQMLTTLPDTINQLIEAAKNFDIDKYLNVKRFAEVANGNRDITTNQPIEK